MTDVDIAAPSRVASSGGMENQRMIEGVWAKTRTVSRALLGALALLTPWIAAGNGGPVGFTPATGAGDVAPTQESRVRLVSERLRIVLDDDGTHYLADAMYQLENVSGQSVRVTYGVPISWWRDPSYVESAPPEERKMLRAYPDSVVVEMNGSRTRCKVAGTRTVALPDGAIPGRFAAWCVAELRVPSGRSSLHLRYPGTMEFGDDGMSSQPFTWYGSRRLAYDLTPAGGWAGPVASLDVVVEAGHWADRLQDLKPVGWRRDGTRFVWQLEAPDLATLRAVSATVQNARFLEFRERMTMPGLRAKARASSVLGPQGDHRYDPSLVLDGNPGTAWCSGRGSGGIGEWIEITVDNTPDAHNCGVWGVLVPGYARDDRSWHANNRITRVHVGPCGGGGVGSDKQIEASERADEAFVDLHFLIGPDDTSRTACWRITILEVDPGPAGDTCISELRPVHCQ